jgi:hypothetical protein
VPLAGASPAAAAPPRALLLLSSSAGPAPAGEGLSLGVVSAAQGTYTEAQLLLDITQGARVSSSLYPVPAPPPLSLWVRGAGARIAGWDRARSRAEGVPQLLQPGLLAQEIPGGAAFAGIAGARSGASSPGAAIIAADRSGSISAVSIGEAGTLPARIAGLELRRELVTAELPAGALGRAELRSILATRTPAELVIVLQRVRSGEAGELLWGAAAGIAGGGDHELSSPTTTQRGLISAVDIAPTILSHLQLARPAAMIGRPILTDGELDTGSLRTLMARLRAIPGRRLPALAVLLAGWALLVLLAGALPGGHRWALRTGALAVMWAPVASLVTAALAPGAAVEYMTILAVCLALGALSDRLLPWPRAILAPAAVAVVALSADALARTQLLMRSLIGPDPIAGVRFYGIGNELKAGLAALALAGLASALYPAVRGRRALAATLLVGALLGIVEGAARIGAGVGGAILVALAFALAAAMLLPGALTRRRALAVLISPLLALALLAALDLATAHGTGHFTGSVLDARSAGELREAIVRRYSDSWGGLGVAGWLSGALALALAGIGIRRATALLSPVGADPAWAAALAGGLLGGLAGTLAGDSGPLPLLLAVAVLACVLAYLHGHPQRSAAVLVAADPGRTAVMDLPMRELEQPLVL